jgi:hypothetical protein
MKYPGILRFIAILGLVALAGFVIGIIVTWICFIEKMIPESVTVMLRLILPFFDALLSTRLRMKQPSKFYGDDGDFVLLYKMIT